MYNACYFVSDEIFVPSNAQTCILHLSSIIRGGTLWECLHSIELQFFASLFGSESILDCQVEKVSVFPGSYSCELCDNPNVYVQQRINVRIFWKLSVYSQLN